MLNNFTVKRLYTKRFNIILLAFCVLLTACSSSTNIYSAASNPNTQTTSFQNEEQKESIDENAIEYSESTSAINSEAPPTRDTAANDIAVYITKTGSKYHEDGCKYLAKSKIQISLADATDRGYGACSVCNPPILESNNKISESKSDNIESTVSETLKEEEKDTLVYITKTGTKYHSNGCSYLKKSCIPIKLDDAISSGYTPCNRCNPPG